MTEERGTTSRLMDVVLEGFPAVAVLAVLADGEAVPRVSQEEDRLTIESGGRPWRVGLRPAGGNRSDPLLELIEPRPAAEAAYRFIR